MRNLFIPCNGPGLRGGISVALAISLKEEIHARQSQHDNVHELILTMTQVVAFSILGGMLAIGLN